MPQIDRGLSTHLYSTAPKQKRHSSKVRSVSKLNVEKVVNPPIIPTATNVLTEGLIKNLFFCHRQEQSYDKTSKDIYCKCAVRKIGTNYSVHPPANKYLKTAPIPPPIKTKKLLKHFLSLSYENILFFDLRTIYQFRKFLSQAREVWKASLRTPQSSSEASDVVFSRIAMASAIIFSIFPSAHLRIAQSFPKLHHALVDPLYEIVTHPSTLPVEFYPESVFFFSVNQDVWQFHAGSIFTIASESSSRDGFMSSKMK